MGIAENIRARQDREAIEAKSRQEALWLLEYAKDQCEAEGLDPKVFWLGIAVAAMGRAGISQPAPAEAKVVPFSPMSDDEARRFGQRRIDFGRHGGKRFDDVPSEYLQWLDGERFRDAVDLHRYLESDRFQREAGS